MHEYSVYIEHRMPELGKPIADPEAVSDQLMDDLEEHAGIPTVGPTVWDAMITVDAMTPTDAFHQALKLVTAAADSAGLDAWDIYETRVIRAEALYEEISQPNLPTLVSGPEAAEILGVNRQRVHQLATANPRFPKPLYRLAVGSLWDRRAIEAFDAEWERKPGRPPKPDHAREQATSAPFDQLKRR